MTSTFISFYSPAPKWMWSDLRQCEIRGHRVIAVNANKTVMAGSLWSGGGLSIYRLPNPPIYLTILALNVICHHCTSDKHWNAPTCTNMNPYIHTHSFNRDDVIMMILPSVWHLFHKTAEPTCTHTHARTHAHTLTNWKTHMNICDKDNLYLLENSIHKYLS